MLYELLLTLSGTGENFVLQSEIDKAQVQSVRARDELQRAGASDEFGPRLAALEAAISTTSQALQWRKKAFDEIGAVTKCVELALVEIALIFCLPILCCGQRKLNNCLQLEFLVP